MYNKSETNGNLPKKENSLLGAVINSIQTKVGLFRNSRMRVSTDARRLKNGLTPMVIRNRDNIFVRNVFRQRYILFE